MIESLSNFKDKLLKDIDQDIKYTQLVDAEKILLKIAY